jgi:hypothetical protein
MSAVHVAINLHSEIPVEYDAFFGRKTGAALLSLARLQEHATDLLEYIVVVDADYIVKMTCSLMTLENWFRQPACHDANDGISDP